MLHLVICETLLKIGFREGWMTAPPVSKLYTSLSSFSLSLFRLLMRLLSSVLVPSIELSSSSCLLEDGFRIW